MSEQVSTQNVSVQALLENDNGTRWEPEPDDSQGVGSGATDEIVALLLEQSPLVVNVDRNERCDALVDRSTKWGNFAHPLRKKGSESERLHAVFNFARHLLRSDERMSAAKAELNSLRLGCHCAPMLCHAHVLAHVANASEQKLDFLRAKLLDGQDRCKVSGAPDEASGTASLEVLGVRDALHPKSTLDSTYVECEHGWVLVRGKLDKTVGARCQRVACVASAREWWKKNRRGCDAALAGTKGFSAAAPWTNVAGAFEQRYEEGEQQITGIGERQRAAPSTLTVASAAAATASDAHAISLAWPAALASPFVPDPAVAQDGTVAAFQELLGEPGSTELAVIAELHDVLLVNGAERDAKRDAKRRVDALRAAKRLLELGADIVLQHDGSKSGQQCATLLESHLQEMRAQKLKPQAAAPVAAARVTGLKSAMKRPAQRSQAAAGSKGKRVAFATGLLASAQALQHAATAPLCGGAPTVAVSLSVTCTVLVPVLLMTGGQGFKASGCAIDSGPNLFALLPSTPSTIVGRVDGVLAPVRSSAHESVVQRAMGFAGCAASESGLVALLAGEIVLDAAHEGRAQKMRIVALPMAALQDATAVASHYGWPVGQTTGASMSWRSLTSVRHDERLFAVVASAMQRVQSHIDTAPLAPEELRVGSLTSSVPGVKHAAVDMLAGPSFDELLERGTRLALSFQRQLRGTEGDADFRRFCAGMADRVQLPVIDEIASVFRRNLPSYEGVGTGAHAFSASVSAAKHRSDAADAVSPSAILRT